MKTFCPHLDRITLRRDSVAPMYLQLADAVEDLIKSGTLRPAQPLESEHAMCRRFEISRATTRLAMDELVRRGRVERRQGKGTYVAHQYLRHDPDSMNQLFDTFFAQEGAPTTKVLTLRPAEAPADIRAAFATTEGEQLVQFDRLYLRDGRAVGVSLGWLLPEARVVSEPEISTQSTARIFRDKLALQLGGADMLVRATVAGRTIGRHLGLSERSPVLMLVRKRFLVDGRIAELTHAYMDPSVYEFSFNNTSKGEQKPKLRIVAA